MNRLHPYAIVRTGVGGASRCVRNNAASKVSVGGYPDATPLIEVTGSRTLRFLIACLARPGADFTRRVRPFIAAGARLHPECLTS